MIYLDNAATTLVKPLQVKQAVFDAMGRLGNSARGMHGPAMEAARELYRAREKAADFFGVADSSQVAVSYTHLDVYKRQQGGHCEKERGGRLY